MTGCVFYLRLSIYKKAMEHPLEVVCLALGGKPAPGGVCNDLSANRTCLAFGQGYSYAKDACVDHGEVGFSDMCRQIGGTVSDDQAHADRHCTGTSYERVCDRLGLKFDAEKSKCM